MINVTTKVKFVEENDEYEVYLFEDGVKCENATYYTDDKTDALETATAMIRDYKQPRVLAGICTECLTGFDETEEDWMHLNGETLCKACQITKAVENFYSGETIEMKSEITHTWKSCHAARMNQPLHLKDGRWSWGQLVEWFTDIRPLGRY